MWSPHTLLCQVIFDCVAEDSYNIPTLYPPEWCFHIILWMYIVVVVVVVFTLWWQFYEDHDHLITVSISVQIMIMSSSPSHSTILWWQTVKYWRPRGNSSDPKSFIKIIFLNTFAMRNLNSRNPILFYWNSARCVSVKKSRCLDDSVHHVSWRRFILKISQDCTSNSNIAVFKVETSKHIDIGVGSWIAVLSSDLLISINSDGEEILK